LNVDLYSLVTRSEIGTNLGDPETELWDRDEILSIVKWPSVLSLLSKRAGSTHQGAVQGIAGSFGSLPTIIGLTVGGFLYHFLGGAIFLISAAGIFTVLILSFRLLKNREIPI
jgi:MFS family permease